MSLRLSPQRLAVAAAILMVGLAGCSFLPTDSTDNANAVGPSDIDAATLDQHEDALHEAGSFNSTQTIAIDTNDSSSLISSLELTSSYRVNLDADRAYASEDGFLGTTNTFTAGNVTYEQQRYSDDGDPADALYDRSTTNGSDSNQFTTLDPVNTTAAMGLDVIVTENVTYEPNGTTTLADNTTVGLYEAASLDAFTNLDGVVGDTDDVTQNNTTITDASARLAITDDGVIRESSLSITAIENETELSIEIQHTVTDVGTTTVPDPAWLSHAKNETQ